MRSRASFALAVLALSTSLLQGCGGPSVGEISEQELTLTLQGVASAPEVATIGEPERGLGVSRAVLRAGAVAFEPCRSGAAELALAPRAYELLSEPAPSEDVTTAVVELCGLRVELEAAPGTEVEGVPDGATLFVEATDEHGDSITLHSDEAFSLHFRSDATPGFGAEPLLLGVDVSTWLRDVPLEAERRDEASERLRAQLPAAAALFVDTNGNGRLDDDETTPLLESER